MSIAYTRALLRSWGRWASGGYPTGFPRTWAMARIRGGSRATGDSVDQAILACNEAVRRAGVRTRRILVIHYCEEAPIREKAAQMEIGRSCYYERLNEAEWSVHILLEKSDAMCYERRILSVVSLATP